MKFSGRFGWGLVWIVVMTLLSGIGGADIASVRAGNAGRGVERATERDQTAERGGQMEMYLPLVGQDTGPCIVPPRLVEPYSGEQLNGLVPYNFEWEMGEDEYANFGEVEFSPHPDFNGPGGESASSTHPSLLQGTQYWWWYREGRNLEPATTYYWRVRRGCTDGSEVTSAVSTFRTGSGGQLPPAPVHYSPENGSEVLSGSVLLNWLDVLGARDYRPIWIAVDEKERFSVPMQSAYRICVGPNKSYEWRVQARTTYGWGPASEPWTFVTGDVPPCVLSNDPASPFTAPSATWGTE